MSISPRARIPQLQIIGIASQYIPELTFNYSLRFGFGRRLLGGSIRAINPLASWAAATSRPRPGKPLALSVSVKASTCGRQATGDVLYEADPFWCVMEGQWRATCGSASLTLTPEVSRSPEMTSQNLCAAVHQRNFFLYIYQVPAGVFTITMKLMTNWSRHVWLTGITELFVVGSNFFFFFFLISHYVLKYQNWTHIGTDPVTVPYIALPKSTPMGASQIILQH